MKSKINPVGPEDAPPQLVEAEALVKALRRVQRQLRAGRYPGLVEIDNALRAAQQLKTDLKSNKPETGNWGEIVKAGAFLVKLVIELYSLLSYVFTIRRVTYEFRADHQAATGGRWHFATTFSRSAQCRAIVPLTN